MADMGSKPVEPVLEDGMSGECVCLQNMVVANGYSSLATILHVWQSVKVNIAICPCLGQFFLPPGIKEFLDALASLGSMLKSQWVSESLMFLRFCQILGISSEYVQSMFSVCSECVQNLLRVCSECVQSVFRVCSECVQSVIRVSSECHIHPWCHQSVIRVYQSVFRVGHTGLVCKFWRFWW